MHINLIAVVNGFSYCLDQSVHRAVCTGVSETMTFINTSAQIHVYRHILSYENNLIVSY